eukprot:2481147-Rhodomonas_salina.2
MAARKKAASTRGSSRPEDASARSGSLFCVSSVKLHTALSTDSSVERCRTISTICPHAQELSNDASDLCVLSLSWYTAQKPDARREGTRPDHTQATRRTKQKQARNREHIEPAPRTLPEAASGHAKLSPTTWSRQSRPQSQDIAKRARWTIDVSLGHYDASAFGRSRNILPEGWPSATETLGPPYTHTHHDFSAEHGVRKEYNATLHNKRHENRIRRTV